MQAVIWLFFPFVGGKELEKLRVCILPPSFGRRVIFWWEGKKFCGWGFLFLVFFECKAPSVCVLSSGDFRRIVQEPFVLFLWFLLRSRIHLFFYLCCCWILLWAIRWYFCLTLSPNSSVKGIKLLGFGMLCNDLWRRPRSFIIFWWHSGIQIIIFYLLSLLRFKGKPWYCLFLWGGTNKIHHSLRWTGIAPWNKLRIRGAKFNGRLRRMLGRILIRILALVLGILRRFNQNLSFVRTSKKHFFSRLRVFIKLRRRIAPRILLQYNWLILPRRVNL